MAEKASSTQHKTEPGRAAATHARKPPEPASRAGARDDAGSLRWVARSAGNLAVQRAVRAGAVPPPLRGATAPRPVQRKAGSCACGQTCSSCRAPEDSVLQRRPAASEPAAGGAAMRDAGHDALSTLGPGAELDGATRSYFEPRFGRDFGDVRVHADRGAHRAAGSLHARAFTAGSDIVFGAGEYAPQSGEGRRLIAHELTHVVQQRAGAQPVGGVGEEGDPFERQADAVADAVAAGGSAGPLLDAPNEGAPPHAQRAPAVQRADEVNETETKDEFARRVRERAADRLVQNMSVLSQWSTYVRGMEGFQLRAQLMSGVVTEYALAGSRTQSGRERFERFAGTHNPAERAFEGSMLDITSTYRERSNNFIGDLESKAFGHFTTPSTAEMMQVVVGDVNQEDLAPQRWVGPDPRYSLYRGAIERFRSGESGGCQTCHDINWAWGETARQYGSPMPRDDFRAFPTTFPGPAGAVRLRTALQGSRLDLPAPLTDAERRDIVNFVQGLQTGQPAAQATPTGTQPPGGTQPQGTAQQPRPNRFAPTTPLPPSVPTPPQRSALCGPLPPAEDSERRTPALHTWGPASAIIADIIARIDAVLIPLGPRGYRVLGRPNFDALYAMSPDNMESVRNGIIERIAERRREYSTLRDSIIAERVPYEELCPIVDELLPSTNLLVRLQVLDDVHAWQERERILTALELILVALTFMFPPAAVVTVPAGMVLGLVRASMGVDQQRQGEQWSQGIGAGVYSAQQEAEAPGLAERGRSNVRWGLLGFALSAFGTARMVSHARTVLAQQQASQQLLRALDAGAVITHAQFPGVYILSRNGRLLMVTEAGEVLGWGTIANGRITWFAGSPFPGSTGGGGSAIVPYGQTGIVPYGSGGGSSIVPFGSGGGGSSLVPYGGGGGSSLVPPGGPFLLPGPQSPFLLPGPQSPWMLPGPQSPLMLPGPQTPLMLPGTVTPVVDPGGRGLYTLTESQMARLQQADALRLRVLQSRMPASPDELAELVALRQQALGGALPETAGTPEHMLARWNEYLASPRPRHQTFAQWAAGHPSRMQNSLSGVATEARYRGAFEEAGIPSRSAVIQSPDGRPRQIDALIEGGPGQGRDLVQIKAGQESLTTVPRQSGGASTGSSSYSNADALAIDAQFVNRGDRVTWVFEQTPSGPLIRRARESGVSVIIRVDNLAEQQRAVRLMQRAGMSPADINGVTFVQGTTDDAVEFVTRRLGGL